MKKLVTYIDARALEAIILNSVATLTGPDGKQLLKAPVVQKGFVKVEAANGAGSVYVATTKAVGRIDISGFTPSPEAFAMGRIPTDEAGLNGLDGDVHAPHMANPGAVTCQVNFGLAYTATESEDKPGTYATTSRSPEQILSVVEELFLALASLPAAAKAPGKAKKAPAHKSGPADETGWSKIPVNEAKASRIEALKARKALLDAAKAPPAAELLVAAGEAQAEEVQPEA